MSTFAKNLGLPGLPGLPSLPGLPASQHLLKMKFSTRNQGLPGLPSLPGLPGLPKCKKSPFGPTTSLILSKGQTFFPFLKAPQKDKLTVH